MSRFILGQPLRCYMRSERLYRLLDPEASGPARAFRVVHHAMVAAGIGVTIADTEEAFRLAEALEARSEHLQVPAMVESAGIVYILLGDSVTRGAMERAASCDIAFVGVGQMVIRCGGTLNTIANMSMNTPTYTYAYKYAAFDGLRRIAASEKESLDESPKRLSPNV